MGREEGGNEQFGIFLGVHYGGDGDTEVGYWAPEVCGEWVMFS